MATVLLAIVLGALVYSVLLILAAIRYLRVPAPLRLSLIIPLH
jgi:hypothetical protein